MSDEQKPLTKQEIEKAREIMNAWEKVHTAIVFLCGLGRVLKWGLGVFAAIAAAYAAYKGKPV